MQLTRECTRRPAGSEFREARPCPQASEAGCAAAMRPEQGKGVEVALDRRHLV